MKRRTFIGMGIFAAAGATAGTLIYKESFESLVKKIIVKDTASLPIAPGELDRFLADASEQGIWDRIFPFSHKQLLKWHYYLDNRLFSLPYATNYTVYRSKVVGTFLLSTNFFKNKMDTDKPIRYEFLFDPYKYPCSNPFSNLYYPQA